jgi:hypothetical protein
VELNSTYTFDLDAQDVEHSFSFARFHSPSTVFYYLISPLPQNSKKSARNGKLERRRKRHSVKLPRSVSVLPLLKLLRRTRLMPPVLPIPRRLNLLLTLAVSALSCRQLVTNLPTAKYRGSMAVPAAWCIRVMARWPILQTTLTPRMDKAGRCISNVSSQSFVIIALWGPSHEEMHKKEKKERKKKKLIPCQHAGRQYGKTFQRGPWIYCTRDNS